MTIVPHWFLPTNGDSRSDLSLGDAVGAAGSRVVAGGRERAPDVGYLSEIAQAAQRLLDGLDRLAIERAQAIQRGSQSEGQRRMVELHGGSTDAREVFPSLRAGVGLVRGGAGTALVGSHEEVGEGVLPVLRRRGLLASTQPEHETLEV